MPAAEMMELAEETEIKADGEDMALISQPLDFMGQNIYNGYMIRTDRIFWTFIFQPCRGPMMKERMSGGIFFGPFWIILNETRDIRSVSALSMLILPRAKEL